MSTPSSIAEQLARDEGEVPHAYQDHLGFWTIGIGHLIDKRKGGGLSKAAIDFIFAEDLRDKTKELTARVPVISTLDPVRQAVLVNMAFQLGVNGLLAFKRFLGALESHDYVAAIAHMRDSEWYKQTPERAERLRQQMLTGIWH